MTDPDTIARLRAEQQHAARLGPDPSDEAADYWELMPHLRAEDWSARIREAEQAAEWLEDDERDRWPSGWYIGWLIIIALAALLVLAAWGLTSAVSASDLPARVEWDGWFGVSYVEISEPETPDTAAVAVVTFRNEPVHRGNAQFAIALGGIVLDVIMEWQVDGTAERITVLPRGPYIAIPAEITVPEKQSATLQIYPAMM